jgi:hypothetical protein
MGVLLGAVLGAGLALLVGNAETSRGVAAPERERVAVLTASPPGSQPPASTAASSPDPGSDDVSSVNQRADKANKNSQGRRDKPDKAKSKDKPGKGKDK